MANHFEKWPRKQQLAPLLVPFLLTSLLASPSSASVTANSLLNSYGTIFYSGSGNTNLATIPDNWYLTFGDYPQYAFIDNTVTHNGHTSIRIETTPSITREINCKNSWGAGGSAVKPGDRIYATVWIKTDPHTPGIETYPFSGARLGIDLLAKVNGDVEIVDGYPHDGQEHLAHVVPWGSDWTQMLPFDFVIPTTYYTKTVSGKPISPTQISAIGIWLDARENTEPGNAWFADAEVYVNPT